MEEQEIMMMAVDTDERKEPTERRKKLVNSWIGKLRQAKSRSENTSLFVSS